MFSGSEASRNGKTVGMGRIVGDGGTVFHICDMAAIPDFQRKGGHC